MFSINRLFIVFFLISANLLLAQRKIKKVSIEEIGIKAELKMDLLQESCTKEGMNVSIKALSPEGLDEFFYRSSQISGRHNYEYYSKSRSEHFLSSEKESEEETEYRSYLEGLDYLLGNDSISETEYNQFLEKIIRRYHNENANQLSKINYSAYNPFKVGGKYLFVFEITLTNNGSKPMSYTMDDFYLTTQGKQLNSLSSSEILAYQSAQEHSRLLMFSQLLNVHYVNSAVLSPNQSITKYVAFNPIQFNSDNFEISCPSLHFTSLLSASSKVEFINREPVFYAFNVRLNSGSSDYEFFPNQYFILSDSEAAIATGKELYVDEGQIQSKFRLTAIGIRSNSFYFVRSPKLKANDFLNFEKLKRKEIFLKPRLVMKLP
jgi:hypothetical protein